MPLAVAASSDAPDIQSGEGGSQPTPRLHYLIRPTTFAEVRPIFEDYHYRGGSFGGSAKHILALDDGLALIGGAVLGETWHIQKYGRAADGVLELKRLACIDAAPKNTESYFLGRMAWWLRRAGYKRLLAYSDEGYGHVGTIYRAAGWDMMRLSPGTPSYE